MFALDNAFIFFYFSYSTSKKMEIDSVIQIDFWEPDSRKKNLVGHRKLFLEIHSD